MRHGRRAIEYLKACWRATAKSSIKILVHFPGSIGILVHFSGSLRIRFIFSVQSESRFIFSVQSESRFIFSVHSESRFIFSVHSKSHLHFYVPTRPKYSCASLTFEFLRIYSTKIFLRIPDTSISTYLLDQNILAHSRFLHFYVHVPPQPKYSCAHLIPPFLRINSTIIFLLTLDSSISTYHLDHNILAHPRFLNFYVSTRP